MSPRRPRLAIEGRLRSEEEYMSWAATVMRDAEDIRESVTEDRFKAHIIETEEYSRHLSLDPDAADRQLHGLWEKGVVPAFKRMPEVGVIRSDFIWQGQAVIRYRHPATGRWMSYAEVAERL